MSVNKVILVGRLGQNPEVRYTPGGAAVANFSIATSENWMDKSGQRQERTEWHRIVVWGKLAELCNQYLQKGRQVYVEGRLQTRQWQDKDGQTKYTTEIQAQTIQFLGAGAGQGAGAGAGNERSQGNAQYSNNASGGFGGNSSYGNSFGGSNASDASFGGGSFGNSAPLSEPSFTEEDIPF